MKRLFAILPFALIASCADEPKPVAKAPTAAASAVQAAPPPPSGSAAVTKPAPPTPPVAKREPHESKIGIHTLKDDYFWLRNKDTPEVVSYLEAENAYTAKMTGDLSPTATKVYDEALARLDEKDITVPAKFGDFVYYSRTEKGREYPIICRKKAGDAAAKEVVLLDPNELGKGERFIHIGKTEVSDDGNLFAYSQDTLGFRQYTLHIRDLKSGKELTELIPRVDSFAFTADGKQLFYVTEDEETKRANQVHAHILGTDIAKDRLVFEEKDSHFDVDLARSRSRDFIVVQSESYTTSEARLIDARHPLAPPVVVEPRKAGHDYHVDPGRTELYVRTNDHGKNFRLVAAPIKTPGSAHWKELVPHRADVMLENVEAFKDHVVLRERKDATVTLVSLDLKSHKQLSFGPDGAVYELGPAPNFEFEATTFRFAAESPRSPLAVFEENLVNGVRTLLKEEHVPSFDPAKYETLRTRVTARDGKEVPVSLVFAKGTTPDGTHPLYLTAYGAYGVPFDAGFDRMLISLLDRGAVAAVAHVRGGGDLGKAWHEDGRMGKKMNTFTDFIDSAEGLIKTGWAKRGAVAIEGRSAGGLLVGAVVNLRPDLFRAVVASVPFVDVLNSMADETVPLTTSEFEEWGDPKIPEQYDWLAAYSPYDNVAKKDYPAMLIESSYTDSQVMYWEPAKWVAKLRAMKTDANPLYLRMNMKPSGHGGVSGRYSHLRERAFDFAFILHELGADAAR